MALLEDRVLWDLVHAAFLLHQVVDLMLFIIAHMLGTVLVI